MDIKKWIENLKQKNVGRNHLLIMFLCGLLLLLIAIPTKDKSYDRGNDANTRNTNSSDYAQQMELELEQFLTEIEGAGEVAVMITLKSSAEQIVEKDLEIQDDMGNESDHQGGMKTTNQSARTEVTIYDEGNGGSPYVSKEILPEVEGVVVIADGGNQPVVVKNITEAIQALFGIESHKIRIIKKEG